MDAGGGEAENDVAFDDVVGRQQLAAFGCADGKACEIVVAVTIHAGHLGRLAADQRAACLSAAIGDARDDGCALIGIELAGCEIVEEEERLGPLHDEVVDAHGDEIDADRIVDAGVDGDLEFGADAVICRDEDGIGKARGLQVEQAAEAADLAIGARSPRRAHHRLDLFHQRIAGIDVDPCLRIGEPVLLVAHLRNSAPDRPCEPSSLQAVQISYARARSWHEARPSCKAKARLPAT